MSGKPWEWSDALGQCKLLHGYYGKFKTGNEQVYHHQEVHGRYLELLRSDKYKAVLQTRVSGEFKSNHAGLS